MLLDPPDDPGSAPLRARVPPPMLDAIDRVAAKMKKTRSVALRTLLREALAARGESVTA